MGEQEFKQLYGMSREEALNKTRKELRKAAKSHDRKKTQELFNQLKMFFLGDDVLQANETAANGMIAVVMIQIIILLILNFGLSSVGIYDLDMTKLLPYFGICIGQMIIGVILTFTLKGGTHWLKYLLNFFICVTMACTYTAVGPEAALAFAIPVALSIRYLSEKFTRFISVVSGVFLFTSTISNAFLGVFADLNCIGTSNLESIWTGGTFSEILVNNNMTIGDYIINSLKWTLLPELCQFIVIALICIKIAKYAHETVKNQAEVSRKFVRLDTELELATNIQKHMLPNIFPPFPDRPEFDLFASMNPAKEVGGDYFDFFLIDDNTLGLVIADVSGKGVPAALCMMIGKMMIKNEALTGKSPSQVLAAVNNQLCENNDDAFFITAWFGTLNLTTGLLTAANAGHEYPAVMRKGGKYELIKNRHGIVLAGMPGVRYKEHEMILQPGDRLFLYTDGVAEATNAENELFGTDRMLETLNLYHDVDQETLLKGMKNTIDSFVGECEQFDDLTMLGLSFFGKQKSEESKHE